MSTDTRDPVVVYHHRTQGVDAQGIHIHEMCRGFENLGYKVAKVAPHSEERVCQESRSGLLYDIIARLPPLAYEILELGYNLVGIPLLYRTIRREHPVFIYERYSLFNFTGVAVSKITGTPLVVEVNSPLAREKAQHGGLFLKRLAQAMETFIVNQATRTIAVSGVLKRMLVEKGAKASGIVVMPNGINPEEFQVFDHAGRDPAAPVRLGFVGWFRPWHALEEMVAALDDAGVLRAGVELLLVGDGPSRPDLERIIAARNLKSHVTITGAVDRQTLLRHLAAMDIALQPAATSYASPMKLIEYMAAGKAVVAPDQDNIREIVRHDIEALLFAPGDWHAFARQVSELVNAPDKRERLGRAARHSIVAHKRTWTENAARVVKLFPCREKGRSAPTGTAPQS